MDLELFPVFVIRVAVDRTQDRILQSVGSVGLKDEAIALS